MKRKLKSDEQLLLLSPCDPLINGLASGEAFAGGVPVSDSLLSQLPAEQDGASINVAGKVEQADVEVFDLHAGGVDFGEDRKSVV